MLPSRKDNEFPAALREARESKNLNYAEFARLVGITQKNIPKYEKDRITTPSKERSIPTQKTWEKINTVLYGKVQDITDLTKEHDERIYLDKASVEEIIHELKSRGVANVNVNISF